MCCVRRYFRGEAGASTPDMVALVAAAVLLGMAVILAIYSNGVTDLVGLLTDRELAWAGVPDIRERSTRAGIRYRHLPVHDQSVPTRDEAAALCAEVEAMLDAGRKVVFHCVGGLGRTGTLAACFLVGRGASANDAIEAVRRARGPRAIETASQERFVEEYARV